MKSVLLIEDSELLHQLLKQKLQSANLEVRSAFDGEEGLRMAAETHPDIILLDLLLPKKHGMEVFEELGSNPTTAGIPIFVISNSGKPEEIDYIKQRGVADYVIKAKVEPGEIVTKICKLLGIPNPQEPAHESDSISMPTYSSTVGGKKVLIVEDDMLIAELINNKLLKEGYETAIAHDGFEALASVAHEVPDLMLLDLVMPKKGGFEVLAELRQEEQTKKIPILVTSNLSEQAEIDKTKSMGATEYLVKAEFTPEEIVAVVNRYLKAS